MPPPGTVLKDLAHNVFGEFQIFLNGDVWLRPVGGGCEWTAHPRDVRRATYAEANRERAVKTRSAR